MVFCLASDKTIRRPSDVFKDTWIVYDLKGREVNSLKVIRRNKPLDLNKSFVYDTSSGSFEITFTLKSTKYSIFRSKSFEDALKVFNLISPIIGPVIKGISSRYGRKQVAELLFKITSCCQEYPGWTAAHVAAFLGLHYLFESRVAEVVDKLNSQSNEKRDSPLHVSLRTMNRKTIESILSLDPNLDVINVEGNSVLHQASLTSASIFRIIWFSFKESKAKQMMSVRNGENCTPMHLACFHDKILVMKFMLTLGLTVHQVSITPTDQPVIYDDSDPDCTVTFTSDMLKDLDESEMKLAGCPLHWVTRKKTLDKLLVLGMNTKAQNLNMELPLHVFARKQLLSCLLGVLSTNHTTSNIKNKKEEIALHYAVKAENILLIQALVVFDSDVNAVDEEGNSARHLAACNQTQVSNTILHMLNAVGAERCKEFKEGCYPGCASGGTFNGVGLSNWPTFEKETFFKEILMQEVIDTALAEKKNLCEEENDECGNKRRKVRILTLDGGGIRGLIITSILCELGSLLKYPLFNYFDWIVGTSTGSLIGSLLSLKYSPQEIRGLYFKLKDQLMSGPKPYCSKRFDMILKQVVGESTVMSSVNHRKLTITSSLADRIPSELYLFRSYPSPDEISKKDAFSTFQCEKQYLWSACRASGSAPYYFDPHHKYMDGGFVSNNPTLDALTEFINWKQSAKKTGKEHESLGLVVNIGTGRMPAVKLKKPVQIEGPLYSINMSKTLRNVKNIWSFIKILFEQTTMTDFQVSERSMAWCHSMGVPLFRVSPPLSVYHPLDLIDDEHVVKILFETKAYIYALRHQFQYIVQLLDYNEVPEAENQEYRKHLSFKTDYKAFSH